MLLVGFAESWLGHGPGQNWSESQGLLAAGKGLGAEGSCMVSKLEKLETLALVAMLLYLWHVVQRTGMMEKKQHALLWFKGEACEFLFL